MPPNPQRYAPRIGNVPTGAGRRSVMPRISEFFGMTICMYWFDTQKHKVPHFHVRHQGAEAVFSLDGLPL